MNKGLDILGLGLNKALKRRNSVLLGDLSHNGADNTASPLFSLLCLFFSCFPFCLFNIEAYHPS